MCYCIIISHFNIQMRAVQKRGVLCGFGGVVGYLGYSEEGIYYV